jgi:uncharacterized protein YbaR (Trm112 family)
MPPNLMEIIVCPVCKGDLQLNATREADDGDILEGTLRCPACNEDYPIEDGIPNLLPPDMRES